MNWRAEEVWGAGIQAAGQVSVLLAVVDKGSSGAIVISSRSARCGDSLLRNFGACMQEPGGVKRLHAGREMNLAALLHRLAIREPNYIIRGTALEVSSDRRGSLKRLFVTLT